MRNKITNKILFNRYGVINFNEEIEIELSETKEDGFTEIRTQELMTKLKIVMSIASFIIDEYFMIILGRLPSIKDDSIVYYRCVKKETIFQAQAIKLDPIYMSLDDTLKMLSNEGKYDNYSIVVPEFDDETRKETLAKINKNL